MNTFEKELFALLKEIFDPELPFELLHQPLITLLAYALSSRCMSEDWGELPKSMDKKKRVPVGEPSRVASTYSPAVAVPSALVGLTSLFGMGRGGPHRNRHQNWMLVRARLRPRGRPLPVCSNKWEHTGRKICTYKLSGN